MRDYLEKHPEVIEPIGVLFKQNKALGRHAGGVIISENIPQRMPLIMARGELQTPWTEGMTNKHLEEFGWIKFDILGLETLRMIERTIVQILKKQGNENPVLMKFSLGTMPIFLLALLILMIKKFMIAFITRVGGPESFNALKEALKHFSSEQSQLR